MRILLALLPALIYARIEQDDMPEQLIDCYSKHPNTVDGQNTCLGEYLSYKHYNISSIGIHPSAVKWIDSLGRELHLRLRRQAERGYYGGGRRLRVRKEIRTLNDDELENFFDAVNALKKDTSVSPNKYDAFALFHQGIVIPSAHDGPNFVGWHRYLLVLFEDALRTKSRRLTLPYWDSTLDFRMKKPEDTVLFSEVFIGNGKGVVYTGPFALWITPSDNTLLRRDIPGRDSSLIDPNRLKKVFTKRYHREILSPSAVEIDDNLEYHHDAVHRWVGTPSGHMADPSLAAMDPVFFLHHCYIDYLWEQFRERQRKLGINSERDYPKTNLTLHAPERLMDRLSPPIKNIEGYSNRFTSRIYRYADAPSCKNRCGGGRNVFLYCDKKKNGCVSRSRQEFEQRKGFTKIKMIYSKGEKKIMGKGKINVPSAGRLGDNQETNMQPMGASGALAPSIPTALEAQSNSLLSASRQAPRISGSFTSRIVDPRTSSSGRRRRSVHIEKKNNRVNIGLDINLILEKTHENKINSNHVSHLTEDIAVAPIIINSIRNRSMFSSSNSSLAFQTHGRSIGITFETIGLSYLGHTADSINLDTRTHKSESIVAFTFLKPKTETTQVYVRVSDSTGAICQPTCLVGSNNYQDCTGALKITTENPLMYIDAMTGDFGQSLTPYLKFYCLQ